LRPKVASSKKKAGRAGHRAAVLPPLPPSAATAICERPRPGPAQPPGSAAEDLPDVLPFEEDVPEVLPAPPRAADPAPLPTLLPPWGAGSAAPALTLDGAAPPPAAVRHYHGGGGAVPPEVRALGRAERVHRPLKWFLLAHEHPALFVAVAAGVLLLDVALLAGLGTPDSPLAALFVFVTLAAAVVLAALPFLRLDLRSYAVFPDALVVVLDNDFAVIPWDAVTELEPPRALVTADGRRFQVAGHVEALALLYDRARARVRDRLLPRALAAVKAGEAVRFGPFRVSSAALHFRGKALPWSDVARLNVSADPAGRLLLVWRRGSAVPWCRGELDRVVNDWLLLDVLQSVCPPGLLVRGRS
jgi:hypothetical protein